MNRYCKCLCPCKIVQTCGHNRAERPDECAALPVEQQLGTYLDPRRKPRARMQKAMQKQRSKTKRLELSQQYRELCKDTRATRVVEDLQGLRLYQEANVFGRSARKLLHAKTGNSTLLQSFIILNICGPSMLTKRQAHII